jgi:hypothetical protein
MEQIGYWWVQANDVIANMTDTKLFFAPARLAIGNI